jgi:hypothetical protein
MLHIITFYTKWALKWVQSEKPVIERIPWIYRYLAGETLLTAFIWSLDLKKFVYCNPTF